MHRDHARRRSIDGDRFHALRRTSLGSIASDDRIPRPRRGMKGSPLSRSRGVWLAASQSPESLAAGSVYEAMLDGWRDQQLARSLSEVTIGPRERVVRRFRLHASWSLPAHLFELSEWSASCATHNPASCKNDNEVFLNAPPDFGLSQGRRPIYAWTDLTYLLHRNGVSWGYYVVTGSEPDCENDAAMSCAPVPQNANTPGIWNPLPYFDTVKADGQLGNIQSVDHFYAAARSGRLPAVSWVVPSGEVSEHPDAPISYGQSYVTS